MSISASNQYVTPAYTRLDLAGKKVVTYAALMAESGFREALNNRLADSDDARVINYSDLIPEIEFYEALGNKIEINGELVDVSTLDIIDPEKLGLYTSDFSFNVENGLRYQRSCFDFTNSWEFSKLTAAEDFTGMSDAEIYKAIYEKYQYCYGENFYYGDAINYPMPPSDYDDYNKIIRRFNNEVAAALGSDKQVKAARREALYGNMSDREVRQAIIDEYDLSDGMTFRELYQMTYDIWKVGLDGGLHNRLDDLFYDFSTAESRANCDNIATREQYLDTKVSGKYFGELQKFYDCAMLRGNGILPEYSETLNQIRAACGAGSGGISVSSVSSVSAAAENNFQWIKL